MLVKDLMTGSVSCVGPEAEIKDIAVQMRKTNAGIIPVCTDAGKLLGVITDRDLVIRYMAEGNTAMKAKDVMTTKIATTAPDSNLHDAALTMSYNKVRRLPVVRNEKLVGMFSLGDMAQKPIYADEGGDVLCALSKDITFTEN